nr:hypothetical protein [uncultured Chryseobacterium sp.]
MEKSLKFCLSFLGLLIYSTSLAQVNCNTFTADQCKESCEKSNLAEEIQWAQYAQELFDEAIKLYPVNDFAFKEKSIPYLKSDDFITWRKLVDKAVKLDFQQNLVYRINYKFFHDYSTIRDSEGLKRYYAEDLRRPLSENDHQDIVRTVSCSVLVPQGKVAGIIERLIAARGSVKGMFNHYQPEATCLEQGKYDRTLENFEKHSKEYNFAENIYFKSKVSKIRNKDYLDLKTLVFQTYDAEKAMKNGDMRFI